MRHHVHQTIGSISLLALVRKLLKALILQRHLVLWPEFLKLPHDAIGNARYALGKQAVHHRTHNVHDVMNCNLHSDISLKPDYSM